MQAANRVAINTGILYGRMAITVFISLYTTRLILAALGAEDFGIYNVIGGVIALLIFLNGSMTTASQRFMSYYQAKDNVIEQKYIFNTSVILHLAVAILLVLVLEVGGFILFNGVLKIPETRRIVALIVFQFMILSTFFTILSTPYNAVINAHENMLIVAIIGIIEALIKLAIALFITYTTYDKLFTYGILMVLVPITTLVILLFYSHKKYQEVQINFKKYLKKSLFKEMTRFASLALMNSTASIITTQGISIVLNSFFGVFVNAAQGVANQISGQLMAFSVTMQKALNPVIVKSEGGNNREAMLKISSFGNKISFFLLAFFSIPAILEMPYILNLWLKDVPEYAIIFCRLNLIRLTINQLTDTFKTAIEATGKIKKYSYWNSLAWILVLPISYIAFKMGGPPQSIYFCLIFLVLGLFMIRLYFMNQICGLSVLDFLNNVVLRSLTASFFVLVITVVPILIMEPNIIRLLTVFIVSSISFIIFIYFIVLSKKEKQLIISLIKNLGNKLKNRTLLA